MKTKTWFLVLLALILLFSGCSKDKKKVEGDLQIQGVVIDAINLVPLVNVTVQLWKNDVQQTTVLTSNTGWFLFDELESGTYKLLANVTGYHAYSANNIVLNTEQGGLAVIDMYPVDETIVNPFSAISGMIIQAGRGAIPNATISISSDNFEQTNGYFSSVVSNSNGSYSMPAIPLLDFNNNPILSFRVRVVAQGYLTKILTGVVLYENNTTYLNIQMEQGNSDGNVLFSDNFETDKGWEATGFWHRQMNADIQNQVYPRLVQLAPNDNSQGYIPYAYQGTYCFWYGDEANGNFLGPYYTEQDSLSGGNGFYSNQGTLTSPEIDLSGRSFASISFWTFWEIESVNPNFNGFDIMSVNVISENNETNTITKLNPYSDPPVEDRESLPYTSGGFNQSPVWVYHHLDISQYVGQKIRLQFDFKTIDSLYNGFRGWFIDEFRVLDSQGETIPEPGKWQGNQQQTQRTK